LGVFVAVSDVRFVSQDLVWFGSRLLLVANVLFSLHFSSLLVDVSLVSHRRVSDAWRRVALFDWTFYRRSFWTLVIAFLFVFPFFRTLIVAVSDATDFLWSRFRTLVVAVHDCFWMVLRRFVLHYGRYRRGFGRLSSRVVPGICNRMYPSDKNGNPWIV